MQGAAFVKSVWAHWREKCKTLTGDTSAQQDKSCGTVGSALAMLEW